MTPATRTHLEQSGPFEHVAVMTPRHPSDAERVQNLLTGELQPAAAPRKVK
jgi:hypothetical protein